ncbi:MAG: hypothetical protein IKV59_09915 [Lachnospiraceae bacterium]|nr:hypothetical protein [Lachnospiraceae bacterium]
MSQKNLKQLLEDEAFLKKIDGMDEEAAAAVLAEESIDLEKEAEKLEAEGHGIIPENKRNSDIEQELSEDELASVAGGAKKWRIYYDGCQKTVTKSTKAGAYTAAALHRPLCGLCNAHYKKYGFWYLVY